MGSLLLLIPLLMWLLCPKTPDCNEGMIEFWPQAKKDYCCMTVGRGCITTTRFTTVLPETTPTVAPTPFPTPPPTPPPSPPPPTPPPAPPGPVDPFNCAVDAWVNWAADKKEWCCRKHHICDGTPTAPPAPADPYNCFEGFANWQAGWSVAKKAWCCTNAGKGCAMQNGGCA